MSTGPTDGPLLLCVHGSPRSGGNTDLLLGAVASGAQEAGGRAEHLYARELDIRTCTGCGACARTGDCVLTDEMDAIYRQVDSAAAIVVGSPVYFLGLPAPLKAVVDRFQPYWSRRYLLDAPPETERPGAFVATAGAPVHSVFTCAQRTVDSFFAVVGVTCRSYLLYENVDTKGAVRAHPRALYEAREAGANLVEAARDAGT